MTKAVAFLSAALLAATLGVAQDTSTSGTASSQSSTPSTQSSSPASGQNSTVQGCLNSTSDNNFTLTQDQTGMVFTLSGSADQLKAHVGHEVAITGQQASGSAASSTTPSSNASANTLQVSDVKMIADHCNAAGAAPSGAAASTAPDASANTSASAASPSTTTTTTTTAPADQSASAASTQPSSAPTSDQTAASSTTTTTAVMRSATLQRFQSAARSRTARAVGRSEAVWLSEEPVT